MGDADRGPIVHEDCQGVVREVDDGSVGCPIAGGAQRAIEFNGDAVGRNGHIRQAEQRAFDLFLQNLVKGTSHLSLGQEAVAAGFATAMKKGDLSFCTYRGHAHTLARGVPVEKVLGELMQRDNGLMRGKGGSMHIADFSVGMLGANGVVAAGLPIACSAAHALKLRGQPQIVACFFGDGAINRGPFLEALNWACVYELPVLFVCEDNRWSATSSTGGLTGGPGIAARSAALGVPASSVDGNDVEVVANRDREVVGVGTVGTLRHRGRLAVELIGVAIFG